MQISSNGLHLIERFEGFRSERYLDSVGVPTIGFGTTASVIDPLPATCTEAEAEGWLALYVQRSCEPALAGLDADLNQNQWDAMCSFLYNEGAGAVNYRIGLALRSHDYALASGLFTSYDIAGGAVLPGLLARREEERALFDTPVSAPVIDLNHYSWFMRWELTAVKRYDALRALSSLSRVETLWLASRRGQLRVLAIRLHAIAFAHQVNAKPSWGLYHRGWRYQQLIRRAAGQRLV